METLHFFYIIYTMATGRRKIRLIFLRDACITCAQRLHVQNFCYNIWSVYYEIVHTSFILLELIAQKNKNYAHIFLVGGRYISDPVKFTIALLC